MFNRLLIILPLLLLFAGCSDEGGPLVFGHNVIPIIAHRDLMPGAFIPLAGRWRNHDGSCVYRSGQTVLSAIGKDKDAAWMQENYSGGSSCETLEGVWKRRGYKTRATYSCDMKFLQWCVDHRLPAAIEYFGGHCVTFVYMDKRWVGLLDNNGPRERIRWIPRREFEREWCGYGGNACTIVASPTPPPPYLPSIRRMI